MDWAAELSKPPFSSFDDAVREFALDTLIELTTVTVDDVVDILTPFILDAGLSADEESARTLILGLGPLQGLAVNSNGRPADDDCSLRSAPLKIGKVESRTGSKESSRSKDSREGEVCDYVASKASKRKGKEAKSNKELKPSSILVLKEEDSLDVKAVAQALQSVKSDGSEDMDRGFVAESFLAYASDKQPEVMQQWCNVLLETLKDLGAHLDEDENDNKEKAKRVIADLYKRRVLIIPDTKIEEGAIVLANLVEDGEWHEALVETDIGDGKFVVRFLEYGKPQETAVSEIRTMDVVVDDEGAEDELREGECEMCKRQLLLTFHHLIPKDSHPTYLKKRLPRGIEGEPTRFFLNTYGLMVCRQCHSMIHKQASNEVLAKEYNTLEKIMALPKIQSWCQWAGQQKIKSVGHTKP